MSTRENRRENTDLLHKWLDAKIDIRYAKEAITEVKREFAKRGFTKEEIKTFSQKGNEIKALMEAEFNLILRERFKRGL